ncbi:hypothetical protein ABZ635_10890 [Nocardiopsis sp. NPDC007018]|uniref:hypothetical protein n=1 Tax=Nocardiopsis sp. NPDC007018 TaxID=3155721 RepID=UPI0033EB3767
MHDTQTSPASSASRPFSELPAPRPSMLAARRPGVRPPQDVRQTCVLMFVTAAVFVGLAYQSWTTLQTDPPAPVVNELWAQLVLAALVALGLVALALPVRRGGNVLWRAAQLGALVALGVAVSVLHTAARLADTPTLLVALVVVMFSIVTAIALWSTSVRRWCAA